VLKGSIDQQLKVLWRNFAHTKGISVARGKNSLAEDKEFIESEEASPLFRLRNLQFVNGLRSDEMRAAERAKVPGPYQEWLFGNDPNERLPISAEDGKKWRYKERLESTLAEMEASVEIREQERARKAAKVLARKAEQVHLPDPTIEADKALIAKMKPFAKSPAFTVQNYLDIQTGISAPATASPQRVRKPRVRTAGGGE
jgi:hypothetical protein